MYNGNNLLQTLNTYIENLESALDNLAPSMAEYYIQSILTQEVDALRSSYIQKVSCFGDYKIIIDYDNNIIVDALETNSEDVFTSSLF